MWVFKGRGADQEAPSPSSAPLRGPAPSAPVRGPAPHQGDQQAIRCACSEIVRARLATLLRASVRAGYHHSSRADRWHEMPAVEVRTTESRRWRRGLRQHRTLGDNNCTGAVGGTGGAPSVVVVEKTTQATCTRPVSESDIVVEPAFSGSGGRTAHRRQCRAIQCRGGSTAHGRPTPRHKSSGGRTAHSRPTPSHKNQWP